LGVYLPKIENRDFVVRHAQTITVNSTSPIPDETKQKICNIISCNYDVINSNDVTYEHRSTQVITVKRGADSYSEANMGCGEGRVQHIIRALEALPEKSLVLLEEPETSLHPSAQHEFAKYLMDVCIRKRHQIISVRLSPSET
jgi:predicted ATPase